MEGPSSRKDSTKFYQIGFLATYKLAKLCKRLSFDSQNDPQMRRYLLAPQPVTANFSRLLLK